LGKRDSWDERIGRARRRWLLTVAGFAFIILLGKLFALQAIEHAEYAADAEKNQYQRLRLPAPRGLIVDRNGEVLVDNVPRFVVVLPWNKKSENLAVIRELCRFLSLDSTVVLTRFDTWIEKNAGLAFPIIKDANKLIISMVRENVDIYPQLRVETRARRRYKRGAFAAHMLGYVGEVSDEDLTSDRRQRYLPGDMIGKTGLELYGENYLRGIDGVRIVQVNAWGTILEENNAPSVVPIAGREVRLTLDAELQSFLEKRLAEAGRGAAVLMDINDGSILAAASVPQFDPNSFVQGINQEDWDRLYNEVEKPLFNRYLQATYPPSSTLKIISTSVILENEIVDPKTLLVYCPGAYQFGNRIFKCWKETGHGWMDLYGAFIQSCDTYYYKIAEELDVDELAQAARSFGLGVRTGYELGGEARGLVPDREFYNKRFGKGKWTQGHVLNNVIGQGEFLVNLLQMIRVAAAIGNGGYLVSPHVIQAIATEPTAVHLKRRVPGLSNRTRSFLVRSMEGVVQHQDGTAYWTRIDGLPRSGKTGTSQNPHGKPHAWFIGYAPADKPRVAIAVLIENAGHGGEIAAPVARDMFREVFKDELTDELARESDSQAESIDLSEEVGQ
jgi:penicillin-binding protein 2